MATINILMDGDKSVCAYFKKKKFTLTIIASNGTVSGAGTYNAGTQVNIQATANTGYQFDHWSGDLSGSANPTTILMNSNKTVTANFVLIPVVQYTLITSVDPIDGGTITGAGTYDAGANVNVEATPAVDYDFDHWSGVTGKWTGLGMNMFPTEDSYIDTVLANGFTEVRHLIFYNWASEVANSKAKIINWVAKGAKVIWGVTAPSPINATNWTAFHDAILSAAQWAQANGVFEFQIGNEEELRNDNTTLTDAQLIANLKSVATEVQSIFTNGNVGYTCAYLHINNWITAGKGDIDILAANIYRGGGGYFNDDWKTQITDLVNAFGANGTYLAEFSLSGDGVNDYSADEAVQAAALTEMIDYIKASGMTRALFFAWKDDGDADFGVVKAGGIYRLLWNSLLNSGN